MARGKTLGTADEYFAIKHEYDDLMRKLARLKEEHDAIIPTNEDTLLSKMELVEEYNLTCDRVDKLVLRLAETGNAYNDSLRK